MLFRSLKATKFGLCLNWAVPNILDGALLLLAEQSFDLLVTTDQQLRHQQNLVEKNLGIAVLMTTSWPRIISQIDSVVTQINQMLPGHYVEIRLP